MKNIKEGIKLEGMREIIASRLGVNCNKCEIKYIIVHDAIKLFTQEEPAKIPT